MRSIMPGAGGGGWCAKDAAVHDPCPGGGHAGGLTAKAVSDTSKAARMIDTMRNVFFIRYPFSFSFSAVYVIEIWRTREEKM
jgi:hypothetical protein